MIAIDTNVLVHAARSGSAEHPSCLAAVRDLAEGPRLWGLPIFCLGEFVRVLTHPRIYTPPATIDDALGWLRKLLASPTARVLGPGARYPRLLAETIREGDARGNLVFDAQIVAVCVEQGANELLTLDRDFDRFEGLRTRRPPGL